MKWLFLSQANDDWFVLVRYGDNWGCFIASFFVENKQMIVLKRRHYFGFSLTSTNDFRLKKIHLTRNWIQVEI